MQTLDAQALLVAAAIALTGAGSASAASGCRAEVIPNSFVEASRLCGDRAAAPARAAENASTSGPGEVAERSAVSITMPSHRRSRTRAAMRVAYPARGATPRAGTGVVPHAGLIVAVAQRYRINPRLLASMMRTESRGNMRAVSPKGALGLMQVMPGTARSLGISEPRTMLGNPALAMMAGAAYLKRLQGQFGNDVPLVVAAYNAGPGAVVRAKRRVPRYRETQGYVRSVMGGFARPRK